ncbi:MAG: hypothetical protein M5T61_07240 [Acidimicrobiia bacterium]|nr:hypothetical protein [Acidimicrobiia bacterium]
MEPLHRQLGMTDDELDAVIAELGRDPTDLELAMYSVMWSEHCSYKSSRTHLKRFPTDAPWVLVGPGEGAGVIDVGDGLAVAIRIESHNHPSAVEPYQGAATGVGGSSATSSRWVAPHRLDGSAAIRHSRRCAHPVPLRGRRLGDLRLRQLGRCPDRRR